MGKPDLEAVDQAVPCALEDGEVVMVLRVVQDGLECGRRRHLRMWIIFFGLYEGSRSRFLV